MLGMDLAVIAAHSWATKLTWRPAKPATTAVSLCACSVLEGHTGWINDVAVTNNGRRAVTASGDGTARLWETRRWVAGRDLRRG